MKKGLALLVLFLFLGTLVLTSSAMAQGKYSRLGYGERYADLNKAIKKACIRNKSLSASKRGKVDQEERWDQTNGIELRYFPKSHTW